MSLIEPFYFGTGNRLFGIYHPHSASYRNHSVVVAAPLLNESMRSHLALRQVALDLAAAGYDVLRFDYLAMGNSACNPDNVSVADWHNSLAEAASEVQEISGNSRISAVAVRYAANLTAILSQDRRLDRVSLWDPVLAPSDWLASLQQSQQRLLDRHGTRVIDRGHDYSGHRLAGQIIDDLQPGTSPEIRAQEISVVLSNGASLPNSLLDKNVDTREIDLDCDWSALTSQVLYAHETVTALCEPFL